MNKYCMWRVWDSSLKKYTSYGTPLSQIWVNSIISISLSIFHSRCMRCGYLEIFSLPWMSERSVPKFTMWRRSFETGKGKIQDVTTMVIFLNLYKSSTKDIKTLTKHKNNNSEVISDKLHTSISSIYGQVNNGLLYTDDTDSKTGRPVMYILW